MKKETLFIFLLCGSLAGYGWIAWNVAGQSGNSSDATVCMFKAVTGVPCPSCGTTRAVIKLIRGNILDSVLVNPLGVLAAMMLIVLPLWMLSDRLFSRDSLYRWYSYMELSVSRKKWISIPAILLVCMNWLWNIVKGA